MKNTYILKIESITNEANESNIFFILVDPQNKDNIVKVDLAEYIF